jgi:methionyl-tRNA synthetase
LLQLYIDVGEDKPRSVLAGIAQSFEPDDLVDLHIAVVTNLEPTQIFGRTSQAMILAVENELGKLELARFSKDVKPGTRIR